MGISFCKKSKNQSLIWMELQKIRKKSKRSGKKNKMTINEIPAYLPVFTNVRSIPL